VLEIWKPIPGYSGYEASDQGRIRSLPHSTLTSNGHVRRYQGKVLKASPDYEGYPQVNPSIKGKQLPVRVHVLVMLAFVGACPKNREICHGNEVKIDVRLKNLRYDTRSNNIKDYHRHMAKTRV
jgi:hypothetical protein